MRVSKYCLVFFVGFSFGLFAKEDPLSIARRFLPRNPVVVEAGSRNGKDTCRIARLWPHGVVYSFEPDPQNYPKCVKATASLKNIYMFPFALGAENGVATFYQSAEPYAPTVSSSSGSLLKPKEHLNLSPTLFPSTVEVEVITLDSWAKQHGVTKIDFLWLDVQGVELDIMKSSPRVLEHVKVIMSEVEFVEAYEGQYLFDDIKVWLEERGFEVVWDDFDLYDPLWAGNILAVRK